MLVSKNLLGTTYEVTSEYKKAIKIYNSTLKEAEELGDMLCVAITLGNIANHYNNDSNNRQKALECYNRALNIFEELGIEKEIARTLGNTGTHYYYYQEYNCALRYYLRSLEIIIKIDDSRGMTYTYGGIGAVYHYTGNYDKALENYRIGYKSIKKTSDNNALGKYLSNLGALHFKMGEYSQAIEELEESISVLSAIGYTEMNFFTTVYLYLSYKHIGKKYDSENIYKLIEKDKNIGEVYVSELNLRLYELLEDTSYLETAYNQVQEKAANLEPDVAVKFLSYPIPKAIVEEWEKIK